MSRSVNVLKQPPEHGPAQLGLRYVPLRAGNRSAEDICQLVGSRSCVHPNSIAERDDTQGWRTASYPQRPSCPQRPVAWPTERVGQTAVCLLNARETFSGQTAMLGLSRHDGLGRGSAAPCSSSPGVAAAKDCGPEPPPGRPSASSVDASSVAGGARYVPPARLGPLEAAA